MRTQQPAFELDTSLLRPGLRLGVAVSGGADSVALLRALAGQNREKGGELGLVLHVAHLHHGLRGAEADGDLEFVRSLAASLGLPFLEARVDTAAEAGPNAETGKAAETIEEAARRLRYAWFRKLMAETPLDAIATAHTLDDQAETVLAKFLRGAWTEGLSGIHPKLESPRELEGQGGRILRPLLAATRAQVEAYLAGIGQTWREDSSNRHLTFTRNRIRHELLPKLEEWNPQLRQHLAQMAALARDEEAWWQAEIERMAPQLLLPGKPVRGGGRAGGDGLALECARLAALGIALQRRLLRHAAQRLGAEPDFAATEALRLLALSGKAGQRLELAGLQAERTQRELRLSAGTLLNSKQDSKQGAQEVIPDYTVVIPGEIAATTFGLRLKIEVSEEAAVQNTGRVATLRNWKPGDRVRLRYSSGPRKVKEVLEHLRVTGSDRKIWPVLELGERIAWMQGVEVAPEPGISIHITLLAESAERASGIEPRR